VRIPSINPKTPQAAAGKQNKSFVEENEKTGRGVKEEPTKQNKRNWWW